MTLKKFKILSIFLIFGLSVLFHFIYDLFPCFFTSLFFPVNESIWEHNKIIILSFFVMAILEKIYYKNTKNVLFANALSGVLCCFLVIIIFTPIYLYILHTKDNLILVLIIYFISISLSEVLSYHLLKTKYDVDLERLGLLIFSICFISNAIFTYRPLKNPLFYDYLHKLYSLK